MGRTIPDWMRLGARNDCGKVAYATRRAAKDGLQRLPDRGKGMRPYKCSYPQGSPQEGCGWWHNGHLPRAVQRGDVTAGEAYGRKDMEVPVGQRPIDMTEGIMTPREVAARFRVRMSTVYEWARAYQANHPDCVHPQLAAFMTPGGEWRFSVKAVREAMGQSDTAGNSDG
jgi:hypothetical protein